ncbi:hypothetical protein TrST_g13569 [Triparma strigata]|uniref:Choloylglycine hydrolase/NAAA C-terminal domain-containing protein n=1 Tax=Triparma strigata TaxID=1606541 RepID=A0A9W7DZL3_9STRA|nr:hypothetical protein TrST_g13569 [Triparma strigata]
MELGNMVLLDKWHVVAHPRGSSSAKSGRGKNEIGYVSIDVLGSDEPRFSLDTVSEGMNEHGLSVSCQTQRGARYQDEGEGEGSDLRKIRLEYIHLAAEMLETCASTAEVIEMLEDRLHVHGKRLPSGARLHWSVADSSGEMIVVEYVEGELVIRDNKSVGVFTNDPPFDWHVTNLNNYVGVGAGWPEESEAVSVEVDAKVPGLPTNIVPTNIGHGHNLVGLSGSMSPPSRFVMMFLLKQHAFAALGQPVDSAAAVSVVAGLLNKVYIVRGTVPSEPKRVRAVYENSLELTHWATIKIPQERVFMWRSYNNMRWRRIDLNDIDFGSETSAFKPIQISVVGEDGIEDVAFD